MTFGSLNLSLPDKYLACAGISGNEVAVVNAEDLTLKERINWKVMTTTCNHGNTKLRPFTVIEN